MVWRPRSWPAAYYATTVAFALADWAFGANVRAVALDAYPGLRGTYYAVCVGVAVLLHVRPVWSLPVTLVESVLNLSTLMLSVFLPYYALADSVSSGGPAAPTPFGGRFLANFMIAGSVATAAFYQSLPRAPGRARLGL